MFDLIVIGGGPGGYTAAIKAAKQGLDVALIEKGFLGGVCTNSGCIPTKTLVHAAALLRELEHSAAWGIIGEHYLDEAILRQKKDTIVKQLRESVAFLLENHGVHIIQGEAVFSDPHTVCVGSTAYRGEHIIIATGSSTMIPPIPGIDLDLVMTSQTALDLAAIPNRLLIIGAGVIGLEFAYIYNSFGSDVYLVEMTDTLLPSLDAELRDILLYSLDERNIHLHLGAKVTNIDENGTVTFSDADRSYEVTCDCVLSAAGRKANTSLAHDLPLETWAQGIKVNDHLQTSIQHIYCIGDANGLSQLAHAASKQADVAVRNILGESVIYDRHKTPTCIFTNPEIAYVGLNEEEANAQYDNVRVGTFPLSYNGRSITMNAELGLVKIITATEYDQIVGIHMIGTNASEIIHEGLLALHFELSACDLLDLVFAHPTISEALHESCADVYGLSVNK